MRFKIYRYDPDKDSKPYMQDYELSLEHSDAMLLDALIRIKQQRKVNPIYGTGVRDSGTIGGDNIFGAPVRVARDVVALRKALDWAFSAAGPVIVEAIVDEK